MEHIGSAHDEVELELLKTVARQRLAAGQGILDLGLDDGQGTAGGPLPITGSRMGHLVDALQHAYRVLGLEEAAGGDEVFEQLVLARIIEATSKFDSARVLAEAGLTPASYPTLNRRLPRYATAAWREKLAAACAAHAELGPASLVLYDVSTLYFETHQGDGFREPGFSKERRLEPQITIGLLTDQAGFPLMLNAFEGNKGETTTMLPVIQAFQAAHHLQDVTVVADAGMVSMSNQKAIEAAGLSFILGARTPDVPYVVKDWRAAHPDQEIPDGHVFVQPWPASATDGRRDQVIYYRYRADSARRTLHGIDQQIAKAERAVDGKMPVKRNRFVQLSGGSRSVNRTLEAKARALAGIKAYVTNLQACPDGTPVTPDFVIGAYHRLFEIEKSFRMSKHDLQARPIYHHKRESIEAHLSVVFAALAVGRHIEAATGWSIKKFVRTARRYRTIQINAGGHTITAADPLPDDLHEAIRGIHARGPVH
ncbi:MAG: IS1634 family transposase [Phycicoccus sp.]|nr:IS1634 family transposase [Phycicoccus sp.]